MKIRSLAIKKNMLPEKDATFNFGNLNLIHSQKNARGKTSLLRLLLYSLGYDVPATKGLKNFNNITTIVKIENNNGAYEIERRYRHVIVTHDEEKLDFILPQDISKLQSIIFLINNKQLLDNLLGIYYIDQDKGWTLLNRGKAIGNIRFNIEDFLSGISGININNKKEEIKYLAKKIEKYRSMLSLADFQDLAEGADFVPESTESTNKLVNSKNLAAQELREAKVRLEQLKSIKKESSLLPKLIEKYSVCVNVEGKQYPVTKDNISNFMENDKYLESAIRQQELEIESIKKKYEKAEEEIGKRRKLVDIKSTIEELEEQLLKIPIDRDGIERVLSETQSQKKQLSDEIRQIVMNSDAINFMDSVIRKYAKELGVSYYIDDSKKFIVTSELKKYSGKVLFQITYIFKLAYIALVRNKLGLALPIIIDSPRSGEILKDASDKMLNIIRRDYKDHQLIVASVFDDFDGMQGCNLIELNNGVFGTLPE